MLKQKTKGKVAIQENIQQFKILGKPTAEQLARLRDFVRGKIGFHAVKSFVTAYESKSNLTTLVGREVLTRRLVGNTVYSGEITHGAVGDGTPDTNENRTSLVNEVFRVIPASHVYENNVAYIDFVFAADDVDGTFTEFANFIDGENWNAGAGADTGRMFSLIATGGWAKSNVESLFVSCKYTLV